MVDSLKELKPGLIVFAQGAGFKIERITKVKHETEDIVDDGGGPDRAYVPIPTNVKAGGTFKYDNDRKVKYLGMVTYETCNIKSVPPGYVGGKLDKDDFKDHVLVRFLSGNREAWAAYVADMYDYKVDMEFAMIGEGSVATPLIDAKNFVKLDLMAYVIAVHGPMTRDDILRAAAALEGKPWVPTSNNQYFQNAGHVHKKGCQCTLVSDGKRGRKQLYGLGPTGKERARHVLTSVGEGPARAALK